jgi:hypothetical protein
MHTHACISTLASLLCPSLPLLVVWTGQLYICILHSHIYTCIYAHKHASELTSLYFIPLYIHIHSYTCIYAHKHASVLTFLYFIPVSHVSCLDRATVQLQLVDDSLFLATKVSAHEYLCVCVCVHIHRYTAAAR